jgi:rubrerythrin
MVLAEDWWERKAELTDVSKANLERALELEESNSAFYACATGEAEKAGEPVAYPMFKRLGKVEMEHAEAIQKLLGLPKGSSRTESCETSAVENMKLAHAREDRAVKFYSKAADEAQEPVIKEFFQALVEIEQDHLALEEAFLN